MDINAARAAIEAILAAIEDSDLPEFDRVENANGQRVTVWWGGRGAVLGSAKSNGTRDPLHYRRSASWDAIEGEMIYRADLKFHANGDKLDGISIVKRVA